MRSAPLKILLVAFAVLGFSTGALGSVDERPFLKSERVVSSINDGWKFSLDDQKGSESEKLDVSKWQNINVPHTWNVADTFDDTPGYRRGASWYRRTLDLNSNLRSQSIFIYFEGANQTAEVYLNGRLVGKHVGGYSAFSFEITDLVKFDGPNQLAVRVDNSFNASVPPLTGDFNMYGGIYRDVWLITTHPVHFKLDDLASPGVQITTPDLSATAGNVRIKGTISNTGSAPGRIEIGCQVINRKGEQEAAAGTALSPLPENKKGEFSFDYTTPAIPNPRLWSPDDPYLYRVVCSIRVNSQVVDVVEQPLGFRWFRFDANTGFYLNDKHLKLRGTNRHQDYKGLGNALPDSQHIRDMELIKDAGFNFVRLAHYPQDPSVLDAADRLGLLIWEETPLVNYIIDSEAFAENAALMVREMVRQHRNHPSVILWGYMNEIFLPPAPLSESTHQATVKLARELDAIVRSEDPTRYTVIAFHGNEVYNKYGLGEVAQVVGWNLYNGWYGGVFDDFGKFMDEQHKRFPNRPHIISEYGANGDQRLHSANPRRFDSTTEWQRLFHESHLKQINDRPYIAGSAIWNQFDFGAEQRGETIPHLNQKGMYTYDRVPKDIHFFYKASFSKEAVIHIAVDDQKYFSGTPDATHKIDVYTNLPEAELWCNGVSLGKKQNQGNSKVSWDVRFRDGVNTLTASGRRDGKIITDTAKINYRGVTTRSAIIAVNVGSNAHFTDENNLVWLADQPYSKGAWGFAGDKSKFIYSQPPDRNILGTLNDPLLQTMQEGLSGYRFDVSDGEYNVELMFAETKFNAAGNRVFNVTGNGSMLIENLDIAKEVGRHRIFSRRFKVRATDGLRIEFTSKVGAPVLSGIRITRL